MISLCIVLAIAISIAIGYKTKINTGILAICFAYIFGCFVMDMPAKAVIGTWPISIFFVIFAVSLFYNFALVNGTLEKLALHVVYLMRGFPQFLPFVLFLAALIVAALGAGFFTVMAFMAPITLMLCEKINMSKVVGAVAINCGSLAGANFMTSGSGVIFRGLMENAGYVKNISFQYSFGIFICTFLFSIFFISLFLFIPKSNRNIGKDMVIEKPESFDPKQKMNLYLIIAMILIALIPPVLHLILPEVKAITFVNSKIDVGLIAIVMTLIALLLDLADQKQVIARIPWSTLIMICGVGMLVAMALKAGTLDIISGWISDNIPIIAVPIILGLVASSMSFFSSTLGVVTPALFPLVLPLAAATGLNPMALFICIVVGSQASSISPFSSGGSLILGACADENARAKLFAQLLFIVIPTSIVSAFVANMVISSIL